MKKSSCVALGAIWFGAAVSVAEIEAGIQSGGNWPALICGHVLGGLLLFAAGMIGARTGRNAMETTAGAFGALGGRLFATLNILQLVGWTAVMVSQGAAAVHALADVPTAWGCAALAALVAAWLFVVAHDKFHLATVGMVLLAILAGVMTQRLGALPAAGADGAKTVPPGFWTAFEISVAMPLSWLPLISDYTRNAKRPVAGTATAAGVYTFVSIWMYALGMLLARSGASGLAAGIVKAGIGGVGLAVVVFSTMTTTFLDAYSSGESAKAMFPTVNAKAVGVLVCALGAVLAASGIVDRYVDFLYLIASVFAPMAAVLLVSHYVVRETHARWNFVSWIAGLAAYQICGTSPIGPTLTALLVSAIFACVPLLRRR